MSRMIATLVVATPDDLPRLRDWMRQLREVDPMETQQIIPPGATEAAMQRLIDDPSAGRVWIIRVNEQDVGYVALVFGFSVEFGGRTAFIDELFIDANFRGKGIGKCVVEQVIAQAQRLDVRNLLLEVTETNLAAKRLYEASGFAARKYKLMSKWLGQESS